jgi:hypothetical protein
VASKFILYTVIEFKNISIAYLGLSREENIDKAEQLEAMKLNEILGLKFKSDKIPNRYHPQLD